MCRLIYPTYYHLLLNSSITWASVKLAQLDVSSSGFPKPHNIQLDILDNDCLFSELIR